LCAQIFCFAFQAKIPKDFILESPNFMAQWPIFSTKLAEKVCLEFATLGDATLGAEPVFVNVYGAQELIPRNLSLQQM
jgi:hypothetical protein